MISRRAALRHFGATVGVAAWPSAAQAQGFMAFGAPHRSLEALALQLERDYPALDHLPPERLVSSLSRQDDVRLFDVREEEEFAVSRLVGAERLAPHASRTEALRQIGSDVSGRRCVFYCSVGRRSSRMAERVKDGLIATGATAHSLRGGILAWHNLALPLVNAGGRTNYVHPFNAGWRRLLERPTFASMSAR